VVGHVVRVEGGVAEVLDHDRVDAAGREPPGVALGRLDDRLTIALVLRGSGERREVDHPDHRLAAVREQRVEHGDCYPRSRR